jgi:hypothetical protein
MGQQLGGVARALKQLGSHPIFHLRQTKRQQRAANQ